MTKKIKNQKSKIKNIVFFVIILLAFFLRFYDLSYVPPSASLDEVSIGYNAYSILKTGADEYGNKFPLLLRAYDDWRPALYVYLVVPFVKVFGLSAFSVRLPSVILSVLIILSTYFLVLEMFRKWEVRNEKIDNEMRSGRKNLTSHFNIPASHIALLSSFLLAFSPWHIYISRLGHEANAGFAFGLFAIYFFLKFINNFRSIYLYASAILFGFSFYSYQSEKLFIPLIVIALSFIFAQKLMQRKKQVFIAIILGLIITLPVLIATLSPNGLIRLKATSAFNINDYRYTNAAKERFIARENSDILREVINNNRLITIKIFLSNYLSHFNPYWLFTNNADDDFKAPKIGLLYQWEFPFIVLGLIYLILTKKNNIKIKLLLVSWILISPFAASITTGSPHAMRAYTMLPMPQILGAIGAIALVSKISNIKHQIANVHIKYLIFTLYVLFLIFNFLFFLYNYFIVFPREQSDSFQFALSKSIPFVLKHEREYNKVIFSNQDNLYQSYMFFLFGSIYDPKLYQKQGGTKSGGFEETHAFGKYEFRPIEWKKENKHQDILYVGNKEDFPESAKTIKTIDYLNGELGIKIVGGN